MSDKEDKKDDRILHKLNNKVKYLNEIRHEIKKKRIIFDEMKNTLATNIYYLPNHLEQLFLALHLTFFELL